MNTCPNCGKVSGFHSSILQGCMCQYSAPPQRTWVGLTDEEFNELDKEELSLREFVQAIDDRLKEKNNG